jgi:3-oxoacyl-[acyl-carrier-protein] synthase-3
MKAFLKAVEYHQPAGRLDNAQLAQEFTDWTAEKIEAKTGITSRAVAGPDECASDLAVAAAQKLFASGSCAPADIDYLLLCTQSPDYFLPSTACLVQHRLGLATTCGALDFNLGCSGFVCGLSLAKGLIETGQARNVLLITAETYSKFIHPGDKSVRTLFGDAAAATLVSAKESAVDLLGPFVFGTDGSGANNLIVPAGGVRRAFNPNAPAVEDAAGNRRTENNLFMNGPEIFNFTLRVVPPMASDLIARAGLQAENVDHWVFHQANRFMLEHLRKKLGVPPEKFPILMSHCGNTVSSTIPIALSELQKQGKLAAGQTLALVGFGVGYSWAGALARWV